MLTERWELRQKHGIFLSWGPRFEKKDKSRAKDLFVLAAVSHQSKTAAQFSGHVLRITDKLFQFRQLHRSKQLQTPRYLSFMSEFDYGDWMLEWDKTTLAACLCSICNYPPYLPAITMLVVPWLLLCPVLIRSLPLFLTRLIGWWRRWRWCWWCSAWECVASLHVCFRYQETEVPIQRVI